MKKLMLAVAIVFVSSFLYAGQDMQGSMRPAIWRSSRTNTQDGFVLVATGSIFLHLVDIGSPTINNVSLVSFFNSTSNINAGYNLSTACMVNTNVTALGVALSSAGVVYPPPFPPHVYDTVFSSGLVYNKIGGAEITILWDYLLPFIDPFRPYKP